MLHISNWTPSCVNGAMISPFNRVKDNSYLHVHTTVYVAQYFFCKRTMLKGNVPGRAAAVTVEIMFVVGAETDFLVHITLATPASGFKPGF